MSAMLAIFLLLGELSDLSVDFFKLNKHIKIYLVLMHTNAYKLI